MSPSVRFLTAKTSDCPSVRRGSYLDFKVARVKTHCPVTRHQRSGRDRSFTIGLPVPSEVGTTWKAFSKFLASALGFGATALLFCSSVQLSLRLLSYNASSRFPFWFSFLAAVMASAWFGGKGAGWLAVVLSAIAVDRLFLPTTIVRTVNREGIPFLFAFIVCALFANWFSSWRTKDRTVSPGCSRSARCARQAANPGTAGGK